MTEIPDYLDCVSKVMAQCENTFKQLIIQLRFGSRNNINANVSQFWVNSIKFGSNFTTCTKC